MIEAQFHAALRPSAVPASGRLAAPAGEDAALRRSAEAFEAAFLAEMLKHAGVGDMRDFNNGGAGEKAFADFLTREYATEIARTGRLGLAEHIYAGLKAKVG